LIEILSNAVASFAPRYNSTEVKVSENEGQVIRRYDAGQEVDVAKALGL